MTRGNRLRLCMPLLALLAAGAGFTACDDDRPTVEPAVCETPTFAPPGGAYRDSVIVTVECATPEATIRVTGDGSNPTTASAVYIAPISLKADTQLRARAWKEGFEPSSTALAAYAFHRCSLRVDTPNGGDVWIAGSTRRIVWSRSEACTCTVRVDLFREGESCALLADSVAGTDSIEWVVKACGPEAGYKVRVTDFRSRIWDESDATFAIRPPCAITVVAPNGGESWPASHSRAVYWISSGACGDSVSILLLKDGIVCDTISTRRIDASPDVWRVQPGGGDSSGYTIRVIDTSTGAADESDGPFSIVPNPSRIHVTDPDGGERWGEGTTRTIRWGHRECGAFVQIGLLWNDEFSGYITTFARNLGAYEWRIDRREYSADTTGYRVFVQDRSSGAADTSDAPFIIRPIGGCAINLLEPNPSTRWRATVPGVVRWSGGTCFGPLTLELLRHGEVCATRETCCLEEMVTEFDDPGCRRDTCGYSLRIIDRATGATATSAGEFCVDFCGIELDLLGNGHLLWEGETRQIDWYWIANSGAGCEWERDLMIHLLLEGQLCDGNDEPIWSGSSGEPISWLVRRCPSGDTGPYRLRISSPDGRVWGVSSSFTILP